MTSQSSIWDQPKDAGLTDPLPADVIERVTSEFGGAVNEAIDELMNCRRIGFADRLGDRMIRCIVFLAAGDLAGLRYWIEFAREDNRHVIMSAEYDKLGMVQRRDLNRPFEEAEFGNSR
jgi:hypothetical protein